MKMIWDSLGTEFGGRNELYELNYAGNHENIRLETLKMADISGQSAKYTAFVDQALSEYDLSGWTTGDWVNSHKSPVGAK
jgi:4-hydroxyphenylacetate 3-monooxygenase